MRIATMKNKQNLSMFNLSFNEQEHCSVLCLFRSRSNVGINKKLHLNMCECLYSVLVCLLYWMSVCLCVFHVCVWVCMCVCALVCVCVCITVYVITGVCVYMQLCMKAQSMCCVHVFVHAYVHSLTYFTVLECIGKCDHACLGHF